MTSHSDEIPCIKIDSRFVRSSIKDLSLCMRFGICDQQSLRSACAYTQSDQSLCKSLDYSMTVKLLTEHRSEFLSLKGGCIDSSESTLVKMPLCWKSHVTADLSVIVLVLSFQTVGCVPVS